MDRALIRSIAGDFLAMGFAMECAAEAISDKRYKPLKVLFDREFVQVVEKVGVGMGAYVNTYDDGSEQIVVEFMRCGRAIQKAG